MHQDRARTCTASRVTVARTAHRAAPRRRSMLLVSLLCLAALLGLSGCLRVTSSLSITDTDRVDGEIVIATLGEQTSAEQLGVRIPPSLSDQVRVQPYTSENYSGVRLLLSNFSFSDVRALGEISTQAGSRVTLNLTRSGAQVTFNATADLSGVPESNSDIRFSLTFPAEITGSDGEITGNTVSWELPPNETTQLTATSEYSGPQASSWKPWALGIAILLAAMVLLVTVLAYRAHRRSLRAPRGR